jgi:hypothetical protein
VTQVTFEIGDRLLWIKATTAFARLQPDLAWILRHFHSGCSGRNAQDSEQLRLATSYRVTKVNYFE